MAEPYLAQITIFAGNFSPRGYAFCAGQILSIAQSTALFSLVGTTYGGNGQTTFGLPDLRGRSAIGQGQGPGLQPYALGQVAGTETVTLNSLQMPQHNHTAVTTVTSTLTAPAATTAINVLTQPTARQAGPANAFLTGGTDGAGAPLNNYCAAGAGTANTLNAGAATTTVTGGSVASTGNTTVGVAGGSQPFSIRSPYLALNYIIATEGIFPPRN